MKKSILGFCCVSMMFLVPGCNIEESQLLTDETLAFSEWCKTWDLDNCDQQPSDKVPADVWEAGTKVAQTVADSETLIAMERSVYDSIDVQRLLSSIGGDSILAYLNQLPWSRISNDGRTLNIGNATEGSFVIKGLVVKVAPVASIQMNEPGILAIEGITLFSRNENLTMNLRFIDLRDSNRLHMVGDDLEIKDIAINYFAPVIDQNPESDPVAALKSLSRVLFSKDFDWRELIALKLDEDNLTDMSEVITPILGDDQISVAIKKVIESAQSIEAGGRSSRGIVANVDFSEVLECRANLKNIPVLGSVDLTLNFDSSFGLGGLEKTSSGFLVKMYGISTNFGDVKELEFTGSKLKLKVGWVSIPIELESSSGGEDGPEMNNLSCGSGLIASAM